MYTVLNTTQFRFFLNQSLKVTPTVLLQHNNKLYFSTINNVCSTIVMFVTR